MMPYFVAGWAFGMMSMVLIIAASIEPCPDTGAAVIASAIENDAAAYDPKTAEPYWLTTGNPIDLEGE